MHAHVLLVSLFALLFNLVAAQTPLESRTANTETALITTVSATQSTGTTATTSDSHSANTIVVGPTTVSPTQSTGTTATSSDSHSANTIVVGPTTVTAASTAAGQGQSASGFAAPTGRPIALMGAAVAIGAGMLI